jgi:hypothetical protein
MIGRSGRWSIRRRLPLHSEELRMRQTGWIATAGMVVLTLAGANAQADDRSALRAYPEAVPEDTSFDMVVGSQPFPRMKYPVPIIGAKVHPEEVHVTGSGELVFPQHERFRGPWVTFLVGSRGADHSSADVALALPPADAVTSKLVGGYMPGIENAWTMGDLRVQELAFATEGGKFEAATGSEPLIAMVRYTITNGSASPRQAMVAVQFGEAQSGQSVKQVPGPRPEKLSLAGPFIRQEDGAYVACLLSRDLRASFKPLGKVPDPSQYVLVNEKEESVKSPEYAIDVERQGDALTVGKWLSPAGADFYVESSRGHSVSMTVDVEVVGPDGAARPVGKLSRTRFSADVPPAADYLNPGERSAALPWAELAKALPQGKSKLVARCFYISGAGRALVGSWEPIIIFAKPGVTPRFKNFALGHAGENRLGIELALAAGESKSIDLAVPYYPFPQQAGQELADLRIDDELAHFKAFWSRELNQNAEFDVPEARIRDGYRACVANNLLLTDRDPQTGVLMPHPDATSYEAVWSGDSGVIIQAMDRAGYHKEAESMLDYFLARQGRVKPEGDVQSAEGFFNGDVDLRWMNQNGFILWAMSEHYKLTRDEPWLRRVAPQLIKGCDWILRERSRTKVTENGQKVRHYGLLPKGRPSDLYIWDNWYWTDTYSYMGLRGTAEVLAAVGMKDEAARLAAEADDYKACILDSVERSIDPKVKPTFVPPSPYRPGPPSFDFYNETWYTICSPIYMVEAGLLDARGEKVAGLEYWLEKYGLYTGLPAFMSGSIDPYYVYNQSLTQLLKNEPAKFAWTLYSLNAYAMGPGTYCTIEGQNLLTGSNGESWDANRQPHMHSNSRYMDLVRIALLLEDGQTLHLLAGAPRGWLADGQLTMVKRAPSYFGEVNFTAHSRVASGEIVFKIVPPKWQAADVVLHVRPPTKYGKIKSVHVNAHEWKDLDGETVKLGKLTGQADVICYFEKAAENAR